MSSGDAKFFTRGKVAELRDELNNNGKKDKDNKARRTALKRIIANMTMSNNDMIALFPDIISSMALPDLEVKKMCFLYLVNYAKTKPDVAIQALPILLKDIDSENSLIRAQALRTMSYIHVPEYILACQEPTRRLLEDKDPYVRRTACTTVAKLYDHDQSLVEASRLIEKLNTLLRDDSPAVVAMALGALSDIWERNQNIKLTIDYQTASKITNALPDCNEWGQTYILEALMHYVPHTSPDAAILADKISPRLSHANSSVVLTCIRVIIYLMNYMDDEPQKYALCRKMSAPLITLLSKGPEIQYLALRNAIIVIQRRPEVLSNDVKVFFCKYNDPIYVKVTKIELIFMLVTEKNVDEVLIELQEYATGIDIHFVRKAVRAIGKLAMKIESAAQRCIDALLELMNTKVPYIVQEATVVIKDIFRRYPGRFESIIPTLCEHLDSLNEPDAKSAMIWVLGEYATRIPTADALLEDFLDSFPDEPLQVQLALLTATVKLFIQRPTKGQHLVPKVLKWATEETDNPDLRDRGYMYWRLLSTSPAAAKLIVMGDKPAVSAESDRIEARTLEDLCMNIGTLATVYMKPVAAVFRSARPRILPDTPALQRADLPTVRQRVRERELSALAAREQDREELAGGVARLGLGTGAGAGAAVGGTAMPAAAGAAAARQNGMADLANAVNQADRYFERLERGEPAEGDVLGGGLGSPMSDGPVRSPAIASDLLIDI